MTTYVIRNGQLVLKPLKVLGYRSGPYISRFESFESPVTGQTISSWRQRDRDMQAHDACDRRDLSGIPFQKRAEQNARQQQRPDDAFQWGVASD